MLRGLQLVHVETMWLSSLDCFREKGSCEFGLSEPREVGAVAADPGFERAKCGPGGIQQSIAGA
jgi:hypothetical protein